MRYLLAKKDCVFVLCHGMAFELLERTSNLEENKFICIGKCLNYTHTNTYTHTHINVMCVCGLFLGALFKNPFKNALPWKNMFVREGGFVISFA